MPVGHTPKKRYFSISKKGKIRYKDYDENKEYFYDYIEGILTKIDLVEDVYEGEVIYKWHFWLEDADHGQTDVLQVGEASSAARGIIMSLYCIDGPISHVRISPYLKHAEDGRTYTNVWFEHNGQTVDWLEEVKSAIPEAEEVKVGSKVHYDDSKRRKFYRGLAADIKKTKLNTPPAQGDEDDPPPRKTGPGHRRDQSVSDQVYDQSVISDQELNSLDWDDLDDDLPF